MTYTSPEVRDYGTMLELTAATGSGNVEDGNSKRHGTVGSQPTG